MSSLKKAWRVLSEQGFAALGRRLLARVFGEKPIGPLVRYDDARDVDWSTPHPAVADPMKIGEGPYTIAWIMSPPGEASGGHQNIFRFISFLEGAGHRIRVYLYSAERKYSSGEVSAMIRGSSSYPHVAASIEDLPADGLPDDLDAIVATGWETAYPSFKDASPARRYYFVQDYEPSFYPVGSESVLAENTYRFGFRGITAGGWLATRLHDEFGMVTDSFDFGSDARNYHVTNTERRTEVFFYARPATERRGYELGVMALDLFAAARPEATISLVGGDTRHSVVPFPHQNLRGLRVSQLNEVYNRCAVGLVLSLTNLSLLPLELLGAGVIPVVNDGPNNRGVSDNPFIEFTPASPRALADRMIELYDRADLPDHALAASKSVSSVGWEASGARFVSDFERSMRA